MAEQISRGAQSVALHAAMLRAGFAEPKARRVIAEMHADQRQIQYMIWQPPEGFEFAGVEREAKALREAMVRAGMPTSGNLSKIASTARDLRLRGYGVVMRAPTTEL